MKVDFSFLVSAVCSIDLSESEQDVWRMPLHSSMYSYDSKRLQTRVPSMEQVNTAMFIHSMRTSPPVASRSMVSLEDQVKHVANKKKTRNGFFDKRKTNLGKKSLDSGIHMDSAWKPGMIRMGTWNRNPWNPLFTSQAYLADCFLSEFILTSVLYTRLTCSN